MYKCISLWLIVLTIIMTFCVSHQKQPDNDPQSDANVANILLSDGKNDIAMKNPENDSVNNTESTILGKHET
jgi:hypothetical protein